MNPSAVRSAATRIAGQVHRTPVRTSATLDDRTGDPEWVSVRTGLFGMKETFVPLNQASQAQDGLTVPFDKDFIALDRSGAEWCAARGLLVGKGGLKANSIRISPPLIITREAADEAADIMDEALAEIGATEKVG